LKTLKVKEIGPASSVLLTWKRKVIVSVSEKVALEFPPESSTSFPTAERTLAARTGDDKDAASNIMDIVNFI